MRPAEEQQNTTHEPGAGPHRRTRGRLSHGPGCAPRSAMPGHPEHAAGAWAQVAHRESARRRGVGGPPSVNEAQHSAVRRTVRGTNAQWMTVRMARAPPLVGAGRLSPSRDGPGLRPPGLVLLELLRILLGSVFNPLKTGRNKSPTTQGCCLCTLRIQQGPI